MNKILVTITTAATENKMLNIENVSLQLLGNKLHRTCDGNPFKR